MLVVVVGLLLFGICSGQVPGVALFGPQARPGFIPDGNNAITIVELR